METQRWPEADEADDPRRRTYAPATPDNTWLALILALVLATFVLAGGTVG